MDQERPAAPPSRGLEPGGAFGRYTIAGVLGEGGMGRVYRALDERLGRYVALKVILPSPGDADAPERAARLVREARAAAALDHPNAVAIFDVGEIDGITFIAMELVQGRTLRAFIGAAEPPIAVRTRWLADVAAALGAAHDAGLVHRDVKPDNVMIRDDGRVKVLDFGIARRAAAPVDEQAPTAGDGLATITRDGVRIGTPLYMAPEQVRGDPLDGRTDQFAWGVVAYELLAGRPPWGGDAMGVLAKVLTAEAAPLRLVAPQTPAPVEGAIARAMEKDPARRFPSMRELCAAIEPFAAHATGPLDPGAGAGGEPLASAPTELASDDSGRKPIDDGARKPIKDVTTAIVAADAPAVAQPSPRRARWPIPAGIAAIAAVVALVAWRASTGPPAPGPLPSASAAAAPKPTAVTDLPDPASQNVEARAAYRAGLAALRVGGDHVTPFERALELDPSIAEAELQLATSAVWGVTPAVRAHFRKAADLRAKLSLRDQAIVDAIEPLVARQPSDWAEAARRLDAAIARWPEDAELVYLRGAAATNGESFEAAAKHLDRALVIDPGYARVLDVLGDNRAYLGQLDQARRDLERCREVSPLSTECAHHLGLVLSRMGECEKMESVARRMVAVGADPVRANMMLATALSGRGRPIATVREVLKQMLATLPEPIRKRAETQVVMGADILEGAFDDAVLKLAEIQREAASSPREQDHATAARLHALVLSESGRAGDAAGIAEEFLGKRDAWEPDPRAEDTAMAADATPILLGIALRGGRMKPDDHAAKRAEWVRAWEAKVPRMYRSYVWLHGYAASADDADDARAALAALPRYEPLPAYRPATLVEGQVGRTFLLGGRVDDAVAWLEQATKSCAVLPYPIEHTRANLWLGEAREAKGDKEGACAAYRVVLDRWGAAKPRSVTADRARERAKAIGCPR